MIFLGDIAHPFTQPPDWGRTAMPWTAQVGIANLEGSLIEAANDGQMAQKIFSHTSIVDSLRSINIKAVSIANNHVMDWPTALQCTITTLRSHGIQTAGAGNNSKEAAKPAFINEGDTSYILSAFGWEAIRCRRAGEHTAGVNPLEPYAVLSTVRYWRIASPRAIIVLLLHWNYEMELFPQPADRQLAMAAIEAGASAVIGHHPHRVGGIEVYRGCPIAYSLGNWWMPQGVYFEGQLAFGDESLLQLALEWRPYSELTCHWFAYSRKTHQLSHIGSEPYWGSERIRLLTPFAAMTNKDYKRWFRSHRTKKKALPIYRDYRHLIANSLKDRYVHLRHSLLKLAKNFQLMKKSIS